MFSMIFYDEFISPLSLHFNKDSIYCSGNSYQDLNHLNCLHDRVIFYPSEKLSAINLYLLLWYYRRSFFNQND